MAHGLGVEQCGPGSPGASVLGAHTLGLEPVNSPPPKGGGFGLRLKAGSVRPSADMAATHVTLKLSSGSGGAWFLMYSTHMSSVTLPLLTTQ
jgi:hypothetical protein